MDILPDGSVNGKTFSGDRYKGEAPYPKKGETYADYHKRCRDAVEQGFHLGDLGWEAWTAYCKGSGQYEGFDSNTIIK